MKKITLWLLALVLAGAVWQPLLAHGDEKHEKKDTAAQVEAADHAHAPAGTAAEEVAAHADEMTVEGRARWDDFPTLHPLVVHWPVVLLPLALLLQLISLVYRKEGLDIAVLLALLAGFVGAWVAGRYVHPHTHGLSEQARWVLEQHELWADWTVWLSLAALLVQAAVFFLPRHARMLGFVVALLLAGASWSVVEAGHYGSQLVHVEGVGAKGAFLETDDDH